MTDKCPICLNPAASLSITCGTLSCQQVYQTMRLVEVLQEKGGLQRVVNESPDSISIGTPGKGGEIKLYGNFADEAAFKAKIDAAKRMREYANAQLFPQEEGKK